ncbi:MAG: hypothetical protein L3J47_03475 [Sulfurovum sp.]|nr:hypothetical protein [Sulfurovum sp.]
MFKIRHLPQYFLGFLLLVLVAFQGWTYYLGTTDVTFERLTGSKPYPEVEALSLRRYKKGAISPHLFTIKSSNETALLKHLEKDCDLKKINFGHLPETVAQTDKEMVEVIKHSPYVYLSQHYDLQNPKKGRMCLVFRDKEHIYLFINGNL